MEQQIQEETEQKRTDKEGAVGRITGKLSLRIDAVENNSPMVRNRGEMIKNSSVCYLDFVQKKILKAHESS